MHGEGEFDTWGRSIPSGEQGKQHAYRSGRRQLHCVQFHNAARGWRIGLCGYRLTQCAEFFTFAEGRIPENACVTCARARAARSRSQGKTVLEGVRSR